MGGFLDYIPGHSPLHRLNPLTKFILSIVLCAACFLSNSLLFVLCVIILDMLMGATGGVFGRSIRILKSLLKLSIILFIVQVIVVRSGDVIFSLPLGILITDQGLAFSLLFSLRFISSALPLTLMLSVTKINDLTNALATSLKISYKYVFAFTTAIRFIPVFSSEMSDIMEAQTARGVDFDTKNFFKKIKLLLPLCVPLLISSVKRIDSGAVTCELRGFNLRKKTSGYKKYPFKAADILALSAGALLVAAAVIF